MSFLTKLSGIKADEKQSFRQLFLLSLVSGIGLSYYFVAVNTFLIRTASVSNLPYAYIISGLAGVVLIKIYQHRQLKVGIIRSYRESVIAFFLVAFGVFTAFTKFGDHSAFAIYLAYLGFLFNMPFTIIFLLSFYAICSRLYNLAQSKRLLALVGTGEIIASIIGYLTAPLISKMSGSPDYLLPVAAVCILPALLPMQKLLRSNRDKLNHLPVAAASLKKLDLRFFTHDRFYSLIALVSLFSVAAIYFVDYSYLISVRLMADYSSIEIAGILGFFFSILKTGELFFSFLSGHILSSKGVKFSILLLPLLLSGCFALAFTGGMTFGNEPIFILSFIFLAKFVERVIRKALTNPATKVLYQVTGSERLRIEATIEGVLNQISTVLSGVLLLVFSAIFSEAEPLYFLSIISAICFLLFLGWTILSLKLYESYKIKIWTYLTGVKSDSHVEKNIKYKGNAGNSDELPLYAPLDKYLDNALKIAAEDRKCQNIESLAFYSPSILHHVGITESTVLNRKIISSYYSNDNFFYRFAVINFLKLSDDRISMDLLKDLGEISDLQLKIELVSAYNSHGVAPGPSELFYFKNLCSKYSDELILALSSQHDLGEIDNIELQKELKAYSDSLIKLLFELLKVLYDPAAIQVIYEIIVSPDHQDIENRLFALELLDNTLSDELKQHLIPIFEPASFDQKLPRLQRFVSVIPLRPEQQLKQLLMKDYNLVNPSLKEICLIVYYQVTGDSTVLNAFSTSRIKNLRDRSLNMINKEDQGAAGVLMGEIGNAYHLSSLQCAYLYNHSIYFPGKKHSGAMTAVKNQTDNSYLVNINTEGGSVLLDSYALAQAIVSNQSGA